jgi:hypothetical protein
LPSSFLPETLSFSLLCSSPSLFPLTYLLSPISSFSPLPPSPPFLSHPFFTDSIQSFCRKSQTVQLRDPHSTSDSRGSCHVCT